MARLLGPDDSRRLAYSRFGGYLRAAEGDAAIVYADAAGTVLADIAAYDGTSTVGPAIAGSTVVTDQYSLLPKFWYPDGVSTVYVSVNGGPVTPIGADFSQRLDDLTPELDAVEAHLVQLGPNAIADYGAVGDGFADDTTALQALINAGGGYLPPGTYKTTSALTVAASNVRLMGAGKGVTTILYSGPGATLQSDTASVRRHCRIENMTVRNSGAGGEALRLSNAYRWSLRNVTLQANADASSIALHGLGDPAWSTHFNEFRQCDFIGGLASVKVETNVTGFRFFGGVLEGDGYALLAPGTGGGGAHLFDGCAIQTTPTNSGGVIIQVGTAAAPTSPYEGHSVFLGCRMEPGTSTATIHFETNSRNNLIIGGSFDGGISVVDNGTLNYRIVAQSTMSPYVPSPTIVGGDGTTLKLRPVDVATSGGELRITKGTNGTALTFTDATGALADAVIARLAAGALTMPGVTLRLERPGVAGQYMELSDDSNGGLIRSEGTNQKHIFINNNGVAGTISNGFGIWFQRGGVTTVGIIEGDKLVFGSSADAGIYRFAAAVMATDGDFSLRVAGKGLKIKEGTNAKMGVATLVAGAATVNTTAVTSTSRIQLTGNADGGTPGWLRVSARTAGTSFTITSSSATDTSTVAWLIIEPAT
jgi:hypothetical protein